MSYFAFGADMKPICDRKMVATYFAAGVKNVMQQEPDYKQLIVAIKDKNRGPQMLDIWYNSFTGDYALGVEFGLWLRKSCKLSYDSGLFIMSQKGKMQFYYDTMQML